MRQFIVTLELDIANDRAAIRSFLNELSSFLGVPPTELRRVHVHRGCTLIHGFAVHCAVDRLLQYFNRVKSGLLDHPEIQAFHEFVKRWVVSRFQAYSPATQPEGKPPQPRDEESAIIFVHGWGGSREATFGQFPEYASAGTGASAYVYSYPSHWLKKSPSVAFVARNLDNWIRTTTLARRVALFGHSLGGVVSRYLTVIQECRDEKIPVRLVALAASPTNGALLASIASKVPLLRSAQLDELRPNSGFLVDLNERWAWWCKNHIPADARVGSMYAMDDAIVPYTSAIGLDPSAVPIFNTDHTSIVKPVSASDEVVLTLVRFCRESRVGAP